jgi:uncharacterized membrane protein
VKNHLNKILEYTWLAIAIVAVVAFIYYYFNYGFQPVKPLIAIIPISIIFYFVRRQRSRKFEEEEK